MGFKYGIAFSGGGARACGFTHGILAELRYLDLLDKVDIISTNSGGGWAVCPVGYQLVNPIPECGSPPHFDDILDRFSEETISNMSLSDFEKNIPYSSALIGSSSDLNPSLWMVNHTLTYGNRTWTEGVGYGIFEAHNMNTKRYLRTPSPVFDSKEEADVYIAKYNVETAFFRREGFPFMVHLGSLMYYRDGKKYAMPYDFTPVSSGSYGPEKSVITTKGKEPTVVKGRYPTCAFDCLNFKKQATGVLYDATLSGIVNNMGLERPFTLHDACGISSCAYASTAFDILMLDSLVPRYNIPVPDKDFYGDGSNVPRFADGMNTDNSAILPLVVRGVKNIISVLSNAEDLEQENLHNEELARLFGLSNDNVNDISNDDGVVSVHIFQNDQDVYQKILQNLFNAKASGAPAVYKTTLVTVANEDIGLAAGQLHEITFVFLSKCAGFTEHMQELNQDIMQKLEEDPHFPNYSTIGENINHLSIILLLPYQARGLAMLGQYFVNNGIKQAILAWIE